jgi:hypothetical protein
VARARPWCYAADGELTPPVFTTGGRKPLTSNDVHKTEHDGAHLGSRAATPRLEADRGIADALSEAVDEHHTKALRDSDGLPTVDQHELPEAN